MRRLENAIISALANGDPQRAIIVTADLPDWLREPLPEPVDGADQPLQARKKTTRQDTLWALEQTNGHHEKAARRLGISRAKLFRLKKKFDVR